MIELRQQCKHSGVNCSLKSNFYKWILRHWFVILRAMKKKRKRKFHYIFLSLSIQFACIFTKKALISGGSLSLNCMHLGTNTLFYRRFFFTSISDLNLKLIFRFFWYHIGIVRPNVIHKKFLCIGNELIFSCKNLKKKKMKFQ